MGISTRQRSAAVLVRVMLVGLAFTGLAVHPGFAQVAAGPANVAVPVHLITPVNFEQVSASSAVRQIADWIIDAGDNKTMPFAIIDKTTAQVFVFFADGRLRGSAAVLLGAAVGDDSVPGIGQRKLTSIRPEERTTPAGRFVASLDHNLHGEQILWVDYDAAISLHRVITSNPKEHRAQRLASATPLDNRISYGCINVPAAFFDKVINPAFTGTNGVVYVLPETRSAQSVFASYDVSAQVAQRLASKQ